LSQEAKIEGR